MCIDNTLPLFIYADTHTHTHAQNHMQTQNVKHMYALIYPYMHILYMHTHIKTHNPYTHIYTQTQNALHMNTQIHIYTNTLNNFNLSSYKKKTHTRTTTH